MSKTTTTTKFQQLATELADAFESDKREPYELRAMKAALTTLGEINWPENSRPDAYSMLQNAIREAEEKRDTFYRLKDDVPAWIGEHRLMRKVHEALDGRFPDDWVFEQAAHIASHLSGYANAEDAKDAVSEIADGLVDVYNTDRAQWLASNLDNAALVDEAISEFGYNSDSGIFGVIGAGQYMALERITNALIDQIEQASTEEKEE